MTGTYITLIIIASALVSFITSARITNVLMQRWGFEGGDVTVSSIVIGAVMALGMCFISAAAIDLAGVFGGLISVFASVPLVGIVWIYIVGGNKVLERLLDRLSARIS